jgi:hypothetical protein
MVIKSLNLDPEKQNTPFLQDTRESVVLSKISEDFEIWAVNKEINLF